MTSGEIEKRLKNDHPVPHTEELDRKIRIWRINASYAIAANIYARKYVRVRALATMIMIGSIIETIRAGAQGSYLWATVSFLTVLASFSVRRRMGEIAQRKVKETDRRHGANMGKAHW